jgi:hypothetical protein
VSLLGAVFQHPLLAILTIVTVVGFLYDIKNDPFFAGFVIVVLAIIYAPILSIPHRIKDANNAYLALGVIHAPLFTAILVKDVAWPWPPLVWAAAAVVFVLTLLVFFILAEHHGDRDDADGQLVAGGGPR